jgi:hypothetical protein
VAKGETKKELELHPDLVALPPVSKGADHAPIIFICPDTKQRVPTGIETDLQSLRAF